MSTQNFEQFRQIVLADSELQQRLRATADRAEFVALLIACGLEQGYHFGCEEVEEALRAGRRAWLERRVTP